MPKKTTKSSDSSAYFEIEAIQAKKKSQGKWVYFVKWEGFDEEHNTWEPFENVEHCRSILDEFEKEYSAKKNKKLSQKPQSQINVLAKSSDTKAKEPRTIKSKPNGRSWYSQAINKRQTSDSDSEAGNQKNPIHSKQSLSKVMLYEPLEAPIDNLLDHNDNLSQATFKHLSKLSESMPFNTKMADTVDNNAVDKNAKTYSTNTKVLLIDGLKAIVNDPEIVCIQIVDHMIIEKELYFRLIGRTNKGERTEVGYFKNDIVKNNAAIELCSYYEKYIVYGDK